VVAAHPARQLPRKAIRSILDLEFMERAHAFRTQTKTQKTHINK
jgi:hypothetical protein